MTTEYETAYRRLNADISERDLGRLFTPSKKDLDLVNGIAKKPYARLGLTIHLKTFQYLGYFVLLKHVPERIKAQIALTLGYKRLPPTHRLEAYDDTKSKRDHVAALRRTLRVEPFDLRAHRNWVEVVARQAALTKHNVPDIINQLIDELIRRRFELPVFSVLEGIAREARTAIHDQYLSRLSDALGPAGRAMIDGLLKRGNDPLTGWNALKREPKRPTNREVRYWLQHLDNLKRLADQMPPLEIPPSKLRFFRDWARAYDAAQMARLKGPTRYGLAAIFIHAQRGQALDDVVEIYLRFVQRLENIAVRKLQEHRLANGSDADTLIERFLTTLQADDTRGTAAKQLASLRDTFQDKDALIDACRQHLAVRHKDHLPFLVEPHEGMRTLLLNCLDIADLHCLDEKSDSRALLAVLQRLRKLRRKREIDYGEAELTAEGLRWLKDPWPRHVLVETPEGPALDRVFLELAIHFRLRNELKSGELFVPKGNRFDDYREHLLDDERFSSELAAYGETTRIEIEPGKHVAKLRRELGAKTTQVDARFPNNPFAEIVNDKLKLSRIRRNELSSEAQRLEAEITARMTEVNVADVLVDACRWANVAPEFRTVAGEKGRLKDLSLRIVVSLICYGLNLGASQTERSVRLVSRKQVAWLNQQYVTEETLDRAIVKVINCFNQFQLPKYWGSGMSASADGKKWNIYEQNLISERHIRYGGYGGLGYYHVSDRFIALMAHFTTCGTYEAIHILDGLLKNASEIQPDTLHGDTQSQSYPVFALAYLLGIKLMPRIRDLGDCSFSRAEPKQRYAHINPLMDEAIKWDLIEEHLPKMMRIAVSIKAGLLTSSSILRRLGTQNRKNPIYFAFVELGRVIRTMFLLDYVDDVELRKTIHRATNKSEQFNGFMRLVFFGGEGVVAENLRHEQQKLVKWAHLAANLIILHNVNEMTRILRELEAEGFELSEESMAGTSPFRMGHLNRFGLMLVDNNRDSDPTQADWQPKTLGAGPEEPTIQ